MSTNPESSSSAIFIDAPRDKSLQRLFEYWAAKRGSRAAPSRADIRPSEIRPLLANVMIWNVGKSVGEYTIRLVGQNIVSFVGRNNTGESATIGMPEEAAVMMNNILDQVVETRSPRFRVGKAFWHQEKSYRDFEACYLPLSADGEAVDMILGGVKFDVNAQV